MNAFQAWIIPIDPSGQPPLGIWGPTDPRPSNPISGIPGLPGYQPPASGTPPGIWGPTDPRPNPPIAGIPGLPGYNPPLVIWGGGNEPFPTPPIYIPQPPTTEPPPGGGDAGSISNPIELPPTDALGPNGMWKQAYFPNLNGWLWVWVPLPKPDDNKPHVEHWKDKKK